MSKKYSDQFGFSCPNTRNMDTMMRQAEGLRKRAGDADYVEFVATNMERIAGEYAETFQKMIDANKLLLHIKDEINSKFEISSIEEKWNVLRDEPSLDNISKKKTIPIVI